MGLLKKLPINSNEIRYFILFICSLILVIWQYFGMSISLTVIPEISKTLVPSIHSDQINGGLSKTRLSNAKGKLQLDCEIIHSDVFAFCGTTIRLVKESDNGINAYRYSHVQIDLEYNAEQKDSLLVYLNNQEQVAGKHTLEKSNMWAVSPKEGFNHFVLSPNRFFVPSWWIFQNNHDGINQEPDISNVTSLSITTGDNATARKVQMTVHQIVFSGKWIEADDLYLALLTTWLALIFIHGLVHIRTLSNNYKQSKEHNAYLSKTNEFLSIQKNEFETMAKIDKLTGAWNRAGVRDILQTSQDIFKKDATPCTLISLDIDYFKNVNDTYGHDAGDEVLINLVNLIQENTRADDYLARWGGEEFLIICTKTNLKHAKILAETLRAKTEKAPLLKDHKITCSFGLAEFKGEEIKQWFKHADIALYEAKRAGRNRVKCA